MTAPQRLPGVDPTAILVWPARQLAALRRFGRMAAQLWQRNPPLRPDAASLPDYYEPLLHNLALPQEPPVPLDPRFEREAPAERQTIDRVAAIAARTVIANYCKAKAADPAAPALRDQHAKQHGCVEASFIVSPDLPAEFETALFRRGARYRAIVRFSNAQGWPQSDRNADGRGMAIKLRDVAGRTMLDEMTAAPAAGGPAPPAGEQDFLLTNFPVFFAGTVADYTELMQILSMPTGRLLQRAAMMSRFLLFFLRRPPQAWIFIQQAIRKIPSPLRETYHSMTPFLFGADRVVRYVAAPAGDLAADPPGQWRQPGDWSYLRQAMAAELDIERAGARRPGAAFRFSMRVLPNASPAEVEDASRDWRGPAVREVELARLEIPMQQFDTEANFLLGQKLSFNPWNCLPEHRPLGGLNRMRLAVYLASARARHLLNLAGPGRMA